jgi:hypothetical protein
MIRMGLRATQPGSVPADSGKHAFSSVGPPSSVLPGQDRNLVRVLRVENGPCVVFEDIPGCPKGFCGK